jgi:glycosyltransferase involved in cell wall biosynthesis
LADKVIAISEHRKRLLEEMIAADKIVVMRNCVDVQATPCRSVVPVSNRMLLFLGSIGRRKGVYDLIEAARLLVARGLQIQIWIGGGEEEEGSMARAQAKICSLGLEDTCRLLGVVGPSEKWALLCQATALVLPSYAEGLPMSVIEALAAGLPVVATDVGGIGEIVKDGYNGFLVRPGDIGALADKISLLLTDASLCSLMGGRSRQLAEAKLDVRAYVRGLVELYEALMEDQGLALTICKL